MSTTLAPPEVKLPEIEDLTRREFLATAVAAALLAACGDDDPASTPEIATREIEGMFGTVDVPTRPERIVASGIVTVANMIALGVTPAGADIGMDDIPSHLEGRLDGVEDLKSEEGGLDLEKVITFAPDLIIAVGGARNGDWGRESCEAYAQAAPTFCFQQDYNYIEDFKQSVSSVALALGLESKAQDLFDEYYSRVTELRERVEAAGLSDHLVSAVNYQPWNGSFYAMWGGIEGVAIRALGLPQPEWQKQRPIEDLGTQISLEQMHLLADVDTLFVHTWAGGEEDLDALLESPVWQSLKAAQNDRIIIVDANTWNGVDFLGLMHVLDDIERLIIEPAESNPE